MPRTTSPIARAVYLIALASAVANGLIRSRHERRDGAVSLGGAVPPPVLPAGEPQSGQADSAGVSDPAPATGTVVTHVRTRPGDRLRGLAVPVDAGRSASFAFTVAAVALGVAGYVHGHLFHEGYGDVSVVGPLFFLNVIGTATVILMLLRGLVLPFAGGVLSIGLGAIVSILVAHNSGFFGFAEAGYQTTAVIILIAESVAVAFTLLGLWLGRQSLLGPRAGAAAS